MKKLIIAITAIAFIGIGGSPAFAATDPEPLPDASLPLPIECSEQDERVGLPVDDDGYTEACVDFYVAQGQQPPPAAPTPPPPSAPPATTTTTTIVQQAGPLPKTGSGVSPILGMGALLLVGGGIIVVATRRRSTATAS